MIPTLPGPSDIPTRPERPEPTRIPPPSTFPGRLDDTEALRRAVRDLGERLRDLETRVSRLETPLDVGHR